MTPEQYVSLRTFAKQAENIERMVLAHENQMRGFAADGFPEIIYALSTPYVQGLRKECDRLKRECRKALRGTALYEWAADTRGIGEAVFFTLGLLPPVAEFSGPAALWRYCGLHVVDGRGVRRQAGTFLGFNVRLRAYSLYRVGLPSTYGGPYRDLYLSRKALTSETHPSMLEQGEGCDFCDAAYAKTRSLRAGRQFERERRSVAMDCANLGGTHWTPGHRHADALRVTTKAILRDVWRIAHGQEPRFGGASDAHSGADNQSTFALTSASVP